MIWKKNRFVYLIMLLLSSHLTYGQRLPVDRHTQYAYQQQTRNHSGLPGKAYWQNQGNYNINVHFDPASRDVKGKVAIDYHNNSPDTLKTLAFKLYPNLYQSNTMRNTAVSASDLHPGMHLSSILINGQNVGSNEIIVRGTNMILKGVRLLPNQRTSVSIDYQYTLNKGSFNRTGQIDQGTFFLAYFFPRITVYDDVDGWNEYPYLGKEEFYNDYGDFKVSITVPSAFCVWATGELTNKSEVYEQGFVDRINKAEHNDEITDVITEADLKRGNITKSGLSHTWKYEANHVTDFAFAVSRNYVWKASSVIVDSVTKRRTRVDAVYRPDHTSYNPVVEYNRKMVDMISHKFPGVPFPYSHETIIDGLDAMEYPMMVNNLPFEDPKDIIEFTAHEVFHTIFPFYVGTDGT